MAEYKTYLAANVLNDEKIVTYRMLSRKFNVHSNTAKQVLHDFHNELNSKKPGSVHACYMIDGSSKTQREPVTSEEQVEGANAQMRSSPFMSSSFPHGEQEETAVPTRSVTLAKEEDLEAIKNKYDQVHSILTYCIGPTSVENIQVLSDCNRTVSKQYMSEDPLVAGKQYGVIQNHGVKRRTERRQPDGGRAGPGLKHIGNSNIPMISKENPSTLRGLKPSQPASSTIRRSSQSGIKADLESMPSSMADKQSNSKPAHLKREQSSVFQSFSRPKTNMVKQGIDTSAGSVMPADRTQEKANVQEDEPMHDASEDEQEEFLNDADEKENSRKLKRERAERLRKMMDEEDEGTKAVSQEPVEASQTSEGITKSAQQDESSPEPPAGLSGKRRRGRRKMLKKKTIKDDEGYLVTREEPVWESFSDEPAPAKEKAPLSTMSSMGKAKKGGAGKSAPGNIMSFFGKN